jgi:hypothetical protein
MPNAIAYAACICIDVVVCAHEPRLWTFQVMHCWKQRLHLQDLLLAV